MTTRLLSVLLLLLFANGLSYCQSLEPLDIAKKIFSDKPFPEIRKYSTGEYKGKPDGQDLAKGTITKFLLLSQSENNAVVNMTLLDSAGKGNGVDTYLHFEKKNHWKMSAFRMLSQTMLIEMVIAQLEKMTPQQVRDIIQSADSAVRNKDEYPFTSMEDYEFQLGNSRLTLALDDTIIMHFRNHQSVFERIKDSVLQLSQTVQEPSYGKLAVSDGLKNEYRRILISYVSLNDYELGNVIKFSIGGIMDNSVGYFYVKDPKDVPKMSPDNIIMIREIGNGWYIYKTT